MLGLCYRFSEEKRLTFFVKEPHRKYSCKQFNEAREMLYYKKCTLQTKKPCYMKCEKHRPYSIHFKQSS